MMSVYFVEAVETGWIKTKATDQSHPHELNLLKVIEAERDVECAGDDRRADPSADRRAG
jgi:hypothetical protein